ncbi:PKD domain-containing protein [Arcticibacter eurypsychrophilus]|uniref:PKD domain-containing protein n=1 Tax=Arcticibacter eurypsychrophilus TaxID=1434752 RepID=UPI00084D8CFA|nr:PKD domain-containing protein [Arcticibacter eurypsychrophilus]
MNKNLLILFIFLIFLSNLGFSQTPSIGFGNIFQGPYGGGSDITVPITLTGSFKKGCKFELYLSDNTGSFVSSVPIGTFNSHFTTFVNGVIPVGTPAGTGYKLKVRAIDPFNDISIISPSSIIISATPGPTILVEPELNRTLVEDKIWGYNPSQVEVGNKIAITNNSNSNSVVSGILINDYTGGTPLVIDFSTVNFQEVTLDKAYYTARFTSIQNGIYSTKSFVVLNSTANLSLQSVGAQIVCIYNGLSDNVTYTVGKGTDGISSNYPGLIYRFDWGDAQTEYISHNDLVNQNGVVRHAYSEPSCGRPDIPINNSAPIHNAYQVNILIDPAFYTEASFPITTFAKVFLAPKADFEFPSGAGCMGKPVTFTNKTKPGQSEGNSGTTCSETSSYKWYYKKSTDPNTDASWKLGGTGTNFSYVFPTAGTWNIKLVASNYCTSPAIIKDICIEATPVPDFTFTQSVTCTPVDLVVTNLTSEVGMCKIDYLWEVASAATKAVVTQGVTFITPATDRSPKINVTVPGDYILRLNIISACGNIILEKPFTVGGPLTVALPVDQSYCDVLTYTIDFSSDAKHKPVYAGFGSNKTYKWEVTSAGSYSFIGGSSISSKFPIIKFNEPGEYRVKLTYENVCNSVVSDEQLITIYGPIVVNSGLDDVVCDNEPGLTNTTYQLKGNVLKAFEKGLWTITGANTGASFNDATKADAVISNLKPGVYQLKWTISNPAGCTLSDQMSLAVYAKPMGGVLSGRSNVCIGSNVALSLAGSVGNIVQWEYSIDNLNWSIINNLTSTYTYPNLQNVTYFRVKVGSSGTGCTNLVYSSTVKVIPDPVSVGGATSGEKTFCINTSTTTAILLTGFTGQITGWEKSTNVGLTWSPISSSAGLNPYVTPANLTATTHYRAVVKSGQCSFSNSSATIITILPKPTVSKALGDTLCLDNSGYTLRGNNPVIGTGMWTEASGLITINDPTQYNSTSTGFVSGKQYKFTWTISNGVCQPSVSTATVAVLSPISSTIKADRTLSCENEDVKLSTDLISGGDVPGFVAANYSYVWEFSLDNGASWNAVPNGTTAEITVNPKENTSYRRKVKSWGSCEFSGDNSIVTITINTVTPLAVAGEDQILCAVTEFILQGNNPRGNFVGTWTDLAPGSVLVFANVNQFNTKVSGLVAGKIYNLQWSIGGIASCSDQTDVVKITVRKLVTVAVAGAGRAICILGDNSNNKVTLTGNTPDLGNGEKGLWSQVSGPTGAVISNPALPGPVVNGLTAGTYVFQWVINSDATGLDTSCYRNSALVSIKVTAYPVAGTISGGNVSLCLGDPAGELSLINYSTADLLQWQSAVGSAAFADIQGAVSSTYQPGNLLETTTYRVKITQADGCGVFIYTPVVEIKVDKLAQGGTTSSNATQVCIGSNSGTILLNGQLGIILRWESSVDNQVSWTSLAGVGGSFVFSGLNENTWFRAVVKNGSCPEVFSSSILVEVLPNVTVAEAGEDQFSCNLVSINLEGNIAVNGTGAWTKVSGVGGVIENPAQAVTQVSGLTPGTYEFAWTISNGICDPSVDRIVVNNYPALVNQLGGNVTICSGQGVSASGQLPAGGNGIYTYQWETSLDNIGWTVSGSEKLPDYKAVFTTSTYIRRVVQSGPCSFTSNVVLVTVQDPLSNNVILTDQAVCLGNPTAKITGTAPVGGDGTYSYQWQKSIDLMTWTDVQTDGTLSDLQPLVLSESTWYRRVVTTLLCNGDQKSISNVIKVTINPLAKAEFKASVLKSCAPFDLKQVIVLVPYDDRNASYEWFANGISIGSGKDFPGYTIANDGEHVLLKLITTSKFGCSMDSMILEFYTIKSVTAAFTKDKVKGCGPLSVNFMNTSSPLAGANYVWDFGNGQTSKVEKPGVIIFQPHPLRRDTTYVITLTASTDCQSTVFKDTVLVRSMPKATFSPGATTGCSPMVISFSNQSTGGGNTYTFDFGDGQDTVTHDNSAVSHTFYSSKTDTVMVTLTAENECGKNTYSYPIVIYSNTVTAELVVDGNKKSGCAPYTVRFDNNSLGANDFLWDFKDGSIINTSSAPESVSHTFVNPGTYVVSLRASNGCSSGTTTETITVYALPDATFTVSGTQYCLKDTVSFFSKNGASDIYTWNFDDGSISNEANPKHAFARAGQYKVTLTVLQSHADGTKCPSTTTQVISVLPLPVALFTSNSTSVNCAPFKLIVSSTPEDAVNIEWNFGDGGSGDNISSGNTAEHIFTKAGLYQVKEIAYNSAGCIDSVIKTIRITETPQAAFTTRDTMFCGTTATVSFTNQSTYGGSDAVVYRWLVNNSFFSSLKNFTYSFNVPAAAVMPYKFEVKLVAKSILGCPDTVKHTIQFNPLPKADFLTSASIACAPFHLEIQNKSQYADQYAWYLNGVLVSNEATPVGIVLSEPDRSYTLKLVSTNIYGCAASSIEKTILTYPRPEALFTLADSVSCNGKLDLKISNKSIRATKYKWDFGDNTAVSTESAPSHVYGRPGVYFLRLVALSDFCTDTLIRTIRIAGVPEAAFTSNITKGCTQTDIVFQNISVNASTYLWDFGDGSFSTGKNPTHKFSYLKSPFTIKLIAYGEFGCADTTVLTNYITVTAPPVANFSVLPDSVIKIPDYTFTFKNASTGNPVKWQWSFGDQQYSTEENPIHTYVNTGAYAVMLIVTNAEGCMDTLIRNVQIDGVQGYLYVPSGFEPGSIVHELKTFIPKGSGIAKYDIKVFNKWGQLIWQSNKLNDNGTPTEGWDGQMAGQLAPQGVYVWEISAIFIDGSEWKGMKYETGSRRTVGSVHLIR